jgi:hypothetical protein
MHLTAASHRPRRIRLGVALASLVAVLAIVGTTLSPSATATSTSAEVSATAYWLASQVSTDGSVLDPYSSEPSVDWTVNVALALAAGGDQGAALERAMVYVEANAQAYISSGTSDETGHLSWLILLAVWTGADPGAFGATDIDLVSRLMSRLGVAEPGLFGTVDDYTPVTNQSLAILALTASGRDVPEEALTWLLDQQCTAPSQQVGGWQGYRDEVSPGVRADCVPVTSAAYNRPDAVSTSFAVQAIIGRQDHPGSAVEAAVSFFRRLQSASPPAAGGFGQFIGDPADPNSTAVVIQALHATGTLQEDWSLGGGDPRSSLATWVIDSGEDSGALSSPYSSGAADLFATFQGHWGIAQFPLSTRPVAVIDTPVTQTEPQIVVPVFTG